MLVHIVLSTQCRFNERLKRLRASRETDCLGIITDWEGTQPSDSCTARRRLVELKVLSQWMRCVAMQRGAASPHRNATCLCERTLIRYCLEVDSGPFVTLDQHCYTVITRLDVNYFSSSGQCSRKSKLTQNCMFMGVIVCIDVENVEIKIFKKLMT